MRLSDQEIYDRLLEKQDQPFYDFKNRALLIVSLAVLVFVMTIAPTRSKEIAQLGRVILLLNVGWTALIALVHERRPSQDQFERMSLQERRDWSRQNLICVCLWKGVYIFSVVVIFGVMAWRNLFLVWPPDVRSGIVLGLSLAYLCAVIVLRNIVYRIALEGVSDNRWGRLIALVLAAASIACAAAGTLSGRLVARPLPLQFVMVAVGAHAMFLWIAMYPFAVYSFGLALIHIRAWRRENRRARPAG